MLSENHNKSDWRNKLEDTDALSSERTDKNVLWEKLHNRLQEKPDKKRIEWYWIAAACLLPVIFISLTFFNTNEDNPVKNNVSKNELPKQELKQIQHVESHPISAVAVGSTEDIIKKKTRKIRTKSNNNIATASANKEDLETNFRIADNETISPLPDSSVVMAVAIAHPKKKLKVVHINELGEPAEDLPVMAHNTNLHYFQLKLANQEVYRSTSLTSNTTGINLFKTKISPSN